MTSAVAELAQLLQRGDLKLPTLSDDELAALSPLTPPEVLLVPLVTHAGLDDDARTERIAAGEQSLIDRGLLAETGERVVESAELRTILALRESPLAVTIVDIVHGDLVESRYAFGLGSDAFVLLETVDAGSHAFAVAAPESAAESLTAEIEPEGLTRSGEVLEVIKTADAQPRAWKQVEEAVSSANATIRLYTVRRTSENEVQELECSLLVTEDTVWSVAGVVDARTGDGRIVARRLTRDALVELLRAVVAA